MTVALNRKQTVFNRGGQESKARLFPIVAKLARNYVAVQASSAASKGLFSVGGNTITKKRNRLSGETAAHIFFLNETLKNQLR